MEQKRRKFKADFKAKVALEALRERKTLAELSQQYQLHPNQISQWKQVVQHSLSTLFENEAGTKGKKSQPAEQELQAEKSRLYEQIGKLQMELEWLKKKYQSFQD